jgi:antiviral helicase SKI2
MGVNAPARTVAFHGLRKHDGKSFRQLLPGEYTQMAGRAGRRGLDKVGTVVVMCWDDIPEEGDLRRLLTGNPTKLESQFRLTYTMILNLLRVEDLKVEDMLKRSFAEFHAQRALPEQQRQLLEREGALSKMNVKIDCILGEPTIEEYYNVALEAEKLGDRIQEAVMQSRTAQQSLVPGRVVVVKTPIVPVPTLGVVVRGATGLNKTTVVVALHRAPIPTTAGKHAEKSAEPKASNSAAQEGYFITKKGNRDMDDDYMVTSGGKGKGRGVMKITLPHYGTVGGVGFVAMEVDSQGFLIMCKAKIRVDSVRLLEEASSAAFSSVIQQLLELEQEHPGQDPPALDAIKDLKLNDLEIVEQYRRRQSLLEVMAQNKCHRCPKLQEHYTLMQNQQQLKERVKQLKYELSDAALQQMPDFQQRIEVLQHVGYIDTDLVVQLKGRVACEINSSDELIATECLFDNQLDHLSPAEAVALLSALVFQQKEASKPLLTPRLAEAKDRLHNTALRLGEVQASFGLPINPEDYASDTLKFGLVEVVYEWAKGTPFADICELTDVPEGSIVRTIVRLDETCRELRNAARIMGDSTLLKKMEDASNAIKRDIVFAASLYVSSSLPMV